MPAETEIKQARESSRCNSSSLAQEGPKSTVRTDGGLVAWLQVLGAFCLSFTTWGIVNSFGVYQSYYQDELFTSSSAFQISWIGSIQAFLLLVIGVATGPLFDRGYLNSLLLVGSLLTVLGIMMTSLCKTYWQAVLAQGVCIGLGAGCLFVPSIAVVATYFTKRRAIAMGIAVGGSSIGGIIYPITFRGLEPRLGFGWTTRIIGFITLALLCTAIATMWNRSPSKPPRSLFQPSAFKSRAYTFQSFGIMFGFLGLYVPVFYLQTYALTRGAISDVNYAFYLLSILNAGSFVGRILPNFLADIIGPMNMIVFCTSSAGVLCLCWIAIDNVAGITVFAIIYGFFAGAYVSLIPPVLVGLTPDMTVVGTWMGMSMFVAAFGLLIGNPVAGLLVNIQEKQFVHAQGFAGGTILLGALLMLMALITRVRQVKSLKGIVTQQYITSFAKSGTPSGQGDSPAFPAYGNGTLLNLSDNGFPQTQDLTANQRYLYLQLIPNENSSSYTPAYPAVTNSLD